MDIKQLTEKLSKSSTSYQGKYVPWWSNRENDSMHRYNIFSKEEIEEAEDAVASAADDELTSPVCAYKYTPLHLLVWHNFYNVLIVLGDFLYYPQGNHTFLCYCGIFTAPISL